MPVSVEHGLGGVEEQNAPAVRVRARGLEVHYAEDARITLPDLTLGAGEELALVRSLRMRLFANLLTVVAVLLGVGLALVVPLSLRAFQQAGRDRGGADF